MTATLPIDMPKAKAQPMAAKDLLERLRRHYIKPGPLPGGIFLAECGINGGASGQRVDAVHVGFTSSSGRILTGHEIKVSRGDWLHELDQPDKADLWADQCHAWYLVTPRDLVRPEELPHGWGLMVPSARTTTRMDVVVKAKVKSPDIGQHNPSWLIVRSIMARQDTLRANAIEHARRDFADDARIKIDEARREFAAKGAAVHDGTIERVAKIMAVANKQLQDESGNSWTSADDADIVAAIVDHARAREAAKQLRYKLQSVVRSASEVSRPFAQAYGELAQLLAEVEAAS